MATRAISAELRSAMKQLRLGQLLPTLAERIALAEKDSMGITDFLLVLFSDEVERRKSTASTRRAASAGLDPDMVIERGDKSAEVSFDRRVLSELCSLRFIEARRNVVVLGPVGVGKTFLASALGQLACQSGFRVRFERADALMRMLRQSRLDNSREALMTDLTTAPVRSSRATETPPSGSPSSTTRCSAKALSTASRTMPTTSSSTASPTEQGSNLT